jgi:hypothetical protein
MFFPPPPLSLACACWESEGSLAVLYYLTTRPSDVAALALGGKLIKDEIVAMERQNVRALQDGYII